jgi:uncharacterized protein
VLDQVLLLVTAFIANALSSLAGGGAGLLQLPALIFLGLPFSVALVTHKIASVALGVGACIPHWRSGVVKLRFATWLLAAGLPGVVLGAWWVLRIPAAWAELALGVMTTSLGIYSYCRPQLGQQAEARCRTGWHFGVGLAVIFGIGVLNGSLTSGTGLFVTLWLVRWFGLDYRQALGYTMILVGLFWNGTGAITLSLLESPHWAWLPVLLAGSVAGGYAGAKFAIAKGNYFIKRLFEGLTIFSGILLLLKAWADFSGPAV